MVNSMTGFAARQGQLAPFGWGWELRSVNARGLDFRPRLPDWIEGLEKGLRAQVAAGVKRGNLSLTLRLQRTEGAGAVQISDAGLARALQALTQVEARARAAGLELAPPSAAVVLQMKDVQQDSGARPEDTIPLRTALLDDFTALLADFNRMRAQEGAALAAVIGAQIGAIKALVRAAQQAASAREDGMRARLRAALAQVLDNSEGVDEGRVAQELALIVVKTDVTEELDRLRAHVEAARALLAGAGPESGPESGPKSGAVGRKLDFLCQEFMREANTLCAKSQDRALTAIGLDLKVVIDQMREQIQNVE